MNKKEREHGYEPPPPLTEEQRRLFDENVEWVKAMAARRASRYLPFDDLFQQGLIGLLEAIRKFDPSVGLKFRTYAQHRILGSFRDMAREGYSDVIKIPRSVKMDGVEKGLFMGARILESSVERSDRAWAPAAPEPEERAIDGETLWREVGRLGKKAALVMLMRYRMFMSREDIAKSLGLSAMRITQISNDSVQRLAENPRLQHMKGG